MTDDSTQKLDAMLADEQARIDIGDPLSEIARRLNVTYTDIAEIIFRPGDISVTLFKRNKHGSFHIDKQSGDAVSETLAFKVLS